MWWESYHQNYNKIIFKIKNKIINHFFFIKNMNVNQLSKTLFQFHFCGTQFVRKFVFENRKL